MEVREVKELAISAIVIALAFSIANRGGIKAFFTPGILIISFLYSMIVVSLGFILHELGHRFVARKFGCYSEYRMWPFGLMLALLGSFFGFLFAAPGAVVIHPRIDLWGRVKHLSRREYGIIALFGPLINFLLAILFLVANKMFNLYIFYAGAYVNTFLGLFNLIPFPPLDGEKIFVWNKKIWLVVTLFGVLLILLI